MAPEVACLGEGRVHSLAALKEVSGAGSGVPGRGARSVAGGARLQEGAVAGLQVGVPHQLGGAGVGEGVAPQVALDVLAAVGVREEEAACRQRLGRARIVGLTRRHLRAGLDPPGSLGVDRVHAGQDGLVPHQQLQGDRRDRHAVVPHQYRGQA